MKFLLDLEKEIPASVVAAGQAELLKALDDARGRTATIREAFELLETHEAYLRRIFAAMQYERQLNFNTFNPASQRR